MNAILVRTGQLADSGLPGIVGDLLESVECNDASRATRLITQRDQAHRVCLLIVECSLASAVLASLPDRSQVRLVVWSGAPSQEEMTCAMRLGAVAYLPATLAPMMMRRALQLVIAGGRYFPHRAAARESRGPMHAKLSSLTPRQVEVLSLVAAGKLNKEIAQALGMSAGTVKVHMTAILKTLEVRNRTEAAVATRDLLPSAPAREPFILGESPISTAWVPNFHE